METKKQSRYSNLDPGNYTLGGSWESYGGGSGLLTGGDQQTGTSDWTSQDTVSVINTGANLLQTVLTSIFGKNNTYLANSYNTLYEQEKRTNTILWVVIGLVLALGVFLVIRKTK